MSSASRYRPVSDRVARLQELGVINRFTLDVDRSQLRAGIPVLITLEVASTGPKVPSVKESLLEESAVEHVLTTAEADLVVFVRVPDNDIAIWLSDTLEEGTVDGVYFRKQVFEWSPH